MESRQLGVDLFATDLKYWRKRTLALRETTRVRKTLPSRSGEGEDSSRRCISQTITIQSVNLIIRWNVIDQLCLVFRCSITSKSCPMDLAPTSRVSPFVTFLSFDKLSSRMLLAKERGNAIYRVIYFFVTYKNTE